MKPKPDSLQSFGGGSLNDIQRDLASPDRDTRKMAISKLLILRPPADVVIELLEKTLADPDAEVREMACRVLASPSLRLSAEQSRALQDRAEQSSSTPDGQAMPVASRCALVASCFGQLTESALGSLERREHILWLIKHEPELSFCGSPECSIDPTFDSVGYQAAKEIWLSHIESDGDNLAILGNAAKFFLLYDRAIAETFYVRARALQPDEPRWHRALAQLYSLQLNDEQNEVNFAAKSLASLREAERVSEESHSDPDVNGLHRVRSLVRLSKSALVAYEFESANNYASELLELTSSDRIPEYFRNGGDAIYYANMVLGCVAVERGDIELAKKYLLASGKTKGSPPLDSFGPNMSLAKRLLESGEREVVHEFFQQCAVFWEMGSDTLEQWSIEVRNGDIPDFGANLVY